jgi:cell division protein FtsB
MGRNRKHQSAAVRFGPALRAFLLCMVIGGTGLGYVWQKSQINRLSLQIKQREQRLGELRVTNEKLRQQLATMQSPPQIDRRVRELNLGLMPPQPNQVLRLTEPELDSVPPPPSQYAAGRPGAPQIP